MKTFAIGAVLGLAVCGVVMGDEAATQPTTQPSKLQSEQQKVSYVVGLRVGSSLKGVDIDVAAMAAGMHDAATDGKPQLSDQEIQDALRSLQKKLMAQQAAVVQANSQKGDAFLVENAKKEGVKTTASGLQYKVITSGTGKTPKATDTVSVNYRGTLVSGKEFDASHGTPVSFQVNRVIPGWTEALQMMKEGDKWIIYIPSKLAYGEEGQGPIGPNETLIFEVELVVVK